MESDLDKDAIFDLFVKGPEGWDINFKPAYESKYISSLRLKAGQSSSVAVEVKPPPMVLAGGYPLTIRVSSGDAQAETALKVALTEPSGGAVRVLGDPGYFASTLQKSEGFRAKAPRVKP